MNHAAAAESPRRLSDLEIRRVRPDEGEELKRVRLEALAYSPTLAEHLARESAELQAFWRARAERAALTSDMATFVAVNRGRFVGLIDGFLSADGLCVEIGGMWVEPTLRRRGIGDMLLEAICDWGRKHRADHAGLWVSTSNVPARALYARAGFCSGASGGTADARGV